jgi:hypothetical protein
MDRIDELLAPDDFTDDELAELEQHLVATTREFHRHVADLTAQVAESDPDLARKLARSADSMLRNVEKAASLPWPEGSPGALAD